jgi:hypothetical protein
MNRTALLCIALLTAAGAVRADEPRGAKDAKTVKDAKPAKGGDKELSGMSIIGNDDAPKSLVIVPWKSSELGDTLDVSRVLDDGRQPVDRDVFMRELAYYQIRAASSGAKGSGTQ